MKFKNVNAPHLPQPSSLVELWNHAYFQIYTDQDTLFLTKSPRHAIHFTHSISILPRYRVGGVGTSTSVFHNNTVISFNV